MKSQRKSPRPRTHGQELAVTGLAVSHRRRTERVTGLAVSVFVYYPLNEMLDDVTLASDNNNSDFPSFILHSDPYAAAHTSWLLLSSEGGGPVSPCVHGMPSDLSVCYAGSSFALHASVAFASQLKDLGALLRLRGGMPGGNQRWGNQGGSWAHGGSFSTFADPGAEGTQGFS